MSEELFNFERHISAGFFHNLVISNTDKKNGLKPPEKEDESAQGGGTTVWGFGSNKHNMLALDLKEVKGGNEMQFHKETKEPTPILKFRGGSAAEVACGDFHSVILDKRPGQGGGTVWICGLGTNGRLGVRRPTAGPKGDDGRPQRDSDAGQQVMGYDPDEAERAENRPKELLALLRENGYVDDQIKKLIYQNEKAQDGKKKDKERRHSSYYKDTTNPEINPWNMAYPIMVRFRDKAQITHIACGVDHSMALSNMGKVYAWGLGNYGNLGNGGTTDSLIPQEVKIPPEPELPKPCCMICAGTKHSMALVKDDFTIYAWGHGGNGRLGIGKMQIGRIKRLGPAPEYQAAMYPKLVDTDRSMRFIEAGEAHSASIDDMGNLYTWGAGSYGRTGHGEEIDVPAPKHVTALSRDKCKQVALGQHHNLALAGKKVFAWGQGLATGLEDTEIIKVPTPLKDDTAEGKEVVEIAAGRFHSLLLTIDGCVYSWGLGLGDGRLGRAKMDEKEKDNMWKPTQIMIERKEKEEDLQTGTFPFYGFTVQKQAKAAALEDQDQQAGDGAEGQDQQDLGDDQDTGDGYQDGDVMQMCCGGMHSGAVVYSKEDQGGRLWIWGSGEHGQMGQGAKPGSKRGEDCWKPTVLTLPSRVKVIQIAFGLEHCLLISKNKQMIYAWGRNSNGQLGTGDVENKMEPTRIDSLDFVRSIAAGEDHSAAVLNSGEVYTWGYSEAGKLGHGSSVTSTNQRFPMPVKGLEKERFQYVTVGAQHTALLNQRGSVFTFGAGWYGRLGHGDKANQFIPKEITRFKKRKRPFVEHLEDIETISIDAPAARDVKCAAYHTCIVTEDDKLYMCGRDVALCAPDHILEPWLFDNYRMDVDPRNDERDDFRVEAIAVGTAHTICVSKQGKLWAWGENTKGQLGILEGGGGPLSSAKDRDQKPGERFVPKLVQKNLYLQAKRRLDEADRGFAERKLDDEKRRDVVKALAKEDWEGREDSGKIRLKSVAAGYAHSMAMMQDGRIYAWGLQSGGRLGLEAQKNRLFLEPKAGQCWESSAGKQAYDKGGRNWGISLDGKCVLAPEKVEACWKEDSKGRASGDDEGAAAEGDKALPPVPGQGEPASPATGAGQGSEPAALTGATGAGGDAQLDSARDSAAGSAKEAPKKKEPAAGGGRSGQNPIKLLQQKLKDAVKLSSLDVIAAKEGELATEYATFMQNILELWESKEDDDDNELKLRELGGRMEGSILRTLKRLAIGEEYPSLDGNKVHDQFQQKMYLWEDMLWCLQQQPCYLARLSQRMDAQRIGDQELYVQWPESKNADAVYKVEIPRELVVNVVKNIFWELQNPRTRTLFMALLRKFIFNELENASKSQDVSYHAGAPLEGDGLEKERSGLRACFANRDSKVAKLMCFFSAHRQHDPIRKLHEYLFDIDTEMSLASKVFELTLGDESEELKLHTGMKVEVIQELKSGNKDRDMVFKKGEPGEVIKIDEDGDALVNFSKGPHWVFGHSAPRYLKAAGDEQTRHRPVAEDTYGGWLFPHSEDDDVGNNGGGEDLKELSGEQFRRLVEFGCRGLKSMFGFSSGTNHDDLDGLGADKDGYPLKCMIKKFEAGLDWEQLLKPMEIKAILVRSCNLIQSKFQELDTSMAKLEGKITPNSMTPKEKVLYEPIAQFWVGSVLSFLVESYQEMAPLSMKHKVRARFKERASKRANSARSEDEKAREKTPEVRLKRFEFNMKQLGKFLHHIAYTTMPPNVDEKLRLDLSASFLLNVAKQIKRKVCDNDKDKDAGRDDTETQLTVNLYTSHYDMQKHYIRMDTVQLLHLSNALWIFKEDISDGVIDMDGGKYQDMLLELLRQIQPREGEIGKTTKKELLKPSNKGAIEHTGEMIWDKYAMAIAERQNTSHNFEVHHRFIEKHRDICFCRECQAPIIRAIAPKNMRQNRELRLITIFKENKGQAFETGKGQSQFPFKELEVALTEISEVTSPDFSLMGSQFTEKQQEKQQKLSQVGSAETAELYRMMVLLEKGKNALDLLKNYNVKEQDFIGHELDQLERRKSHMDYLSSLDNSKKLIRDERTKYMEELKKTRKAMVMALHWSERAPLLIAKRANEFATPLKVQRIEAIKKKEERKQQTGLTLLPSATYTVGNLRAKKVISRMKSGLEKEHKNITFVFSMMEQGDWNIVARYQGQRKGLHTLCSFQITNEEVGQMKKSKKCARLPYADEFVWINCFPLVQLLARIAAMQPQADIKPEHLG